MEFIQARWWHQGRRKAVRLIVIHCTVSREMGTGAEAVARYFATATRPGSAHRTGDSDSVVASVRDGDTAFGAAGANADGLHFELVGMPDQTTDQWLDTFGQAMFRTAAPTMREWTSEYDVPWRWLTVAQVRDGVSRGFCTHHDVSLAFPDVSTGHWDPGFSFPKAQAMAIWRPATPTFPYLGDTDMGVVIRRIENPNQSVLVLPDKTMPRGVIGFFAEVADGNGNEGISAHEEVRVDKGAWQAIFDVWLKGAVVRT